MQKDLTPAQIERELLRLKNELGRAREKLNARAEEYMNATREYKAKYAQEFLKASLHKKADGKPKSARECEIEAQKQTAGEEAQYKAAEQMVLNERKAVDTLLAEVDIVRSLYSKAFEELKRS